MTQIMLITSVSNIAATIANTAVVENQKPECMLEPARWKCVDFVTHSGPRVVGLEPRETAQMLPSHRPAPTNHSVSALVRGNVLGVAATPLPGKLRIFIGWARAMTGPGAAAGVTLVCL